MTHTVYFFSFSLFSHLSSSDRFALLFKMCSRKTLVAITLSFQKIKQEVRDLLCPKNPKKGKNYFEPCFQPFKKIVMGQLKKRQQTYLGEKEEEAITAIRIKGFQDAETFELVPVLELNSKTSQLWNRSLPTATKLMT